jgi:hypothetical protein
VRPIGQLQVRPCPQCPESDGWLEEGDLSRMGHSGGEQPQQILDNSVVTGCRERLFYVKSVADRQVEA